MITEPIIVLVIVAAALAAIAWRLRKKDAPGAGAIT